MVLKVLREPSAGLVGGVQPRPRPDSLEPRPCRLRASARPLAPTLSGSWSTDSVQEMED